MLDITHPLVFANDQGQKGRHHHSVIGHVAIKQIQWVGDAHVLRGFVDVVHQRIDTMGEIIGGTHFHVGPGRGFGRKVGGSLEIPEAALGFHLVRHPNVLTGLDKVSLCEIQVGVSVGLVHGYVRWFVSMWVYRAGCVAL